MDEINRINKTNEQSDSDYEWEVLYNNLTPKKNINNWQSKFGPRVLERNELGFANKIRFQLLVDNKNVDIFLIGEFNDWTSNLKDLNDFKLQFDEDCIFAFIDINCENINIKHKTEYKFLILDKENNTKQILTDPAASYFSDFGNAIFWDFEDPSTYKNKYNFIDTFHRATKIVQTDLPGLITHFANKNGICGKDIQEKQYYKFISESGVIQKIKELGFNTIQFLPFAQSIDGTNWKLRYLVPFQFAIQKNWGNPDEFSEMIDLFHKEGIAVIGDFVLGHLPHKDFQIFGQSSNEHGIHLWKKDKNNLLYLKEETCWGTIRIDFDNCFVRDFFSSSCLHFMKNYKVDGFRIDNIDGIIRYGKNGDEDERPNGRTFLKEINEKLYSYNPFAIIHYEAHYYYGDNAKMLVAPLHTNERALGATAYNSSRLTYFFHTEYMFKTSSDLSVWKYKHITDEKEWGKSNSTIADFHNHDAAAGLMEMRCTGSYAYDSMMEISPSNHLHALGKIKVMEAIIAFCTEGRILDLIQTFLLQTGSFEHDTSIWWHLTYNEVSRNLLNYKRKVNEILEDSAFWSISTRNRKFLNVDDANKVLVIERSSKIKGKEAKYIIVINTSDWKHQNYKVGVKGENDYELVLNSDEFQYSGQGLVSLPNKFENKISTNFELLSREIVLPMLPPYCIVVLKEIEAEAENEKY